MKGGCGMIEAGRMEMGVCCASLLYMEDYES